MSLVRARRALAVAALGLTAVIAVPSTPSGATASVATSRLSGSTRYATAAAAALAAFPGPQDHIILASGESFPDGLAAAGLIAALPAPLLLTRASSLPGETETAIDALKKAGTIVHVLGGTNAISTAVRDALRAKGLTLNEIGGTTRYDTARLVADAAFGIAATSAGADLGVMAGLRAAVVASGESFADALVGGALASSLGIPILLTRPSSLPAETSAALDAEYANGDIELVILLGGTAAVSNGVQATIEAKGIPVVRIGGATRYDTARLFADLIERPLFEGGAAIDGPTAVLVTGENFPDALAAAQVARSVGAAILLGRSGDLPAETAEHLDARRAVVDEVWAIGGTTVLSDAVLSAAAENAQLHTATVDITVTDGATEILLEFSEPVALTAANIGITFGRTAGTPVSHDLGTTWRVPVLGGGLPANAIVQVTGVQTLTGDLVADADTQAFEDAIPPTGFVYTSPAARRVVFAFSEPIDPDSFDEADVTFEGGPGCVGPVLTRIEEGHGRIWQMDCDDPLTSLDVVGIQAGMITDLGGTANLSAIARNNVSDDTTPPTIVGMDARALADNPATAAVSGMAFTATRTGKLAGTLGNAWTVEALVAADGPIVPIVTVSDAFSRIRVEARTGTPAALAALAVNLDEVASEHVWATGGFAPLAAAGPVPFALGTGRLITTLTMSEVMSQFGPGALTHLQRVYVDLNADGALTEYTLTGGMIWDIVGGKSIVVSTALTTDMLPPTADSLVTVTVGNHLDYLADVTGNPTTPTEISGPITVV